MKMNWWAFIISRSLFESEIRFKPPEYLKIWIYLCGKANHKWKKYKWFYLERGQCLVDYNELLEQLEYKIWYRKKKYNDFIMKHLMKFLRSSLMIVSMKQPRWVLITILNYDKYQTLSNYESTNESTNESTSKVPVKYQTVPSINKNEKNEKNKKKLDFGFSEKVISTIEEYNKQRKKKLESLTSMGIELFKKNLLSLWWWTDEWMVAVLENSISNGWEWIFALKWTNKIPQTESEWLVEFEKLSDNWWQQFKVKYWIDQYNTIKKLYKGKWISNLLDINKK